MDKYKYRSDVSKELATVSSVGKTVFASLVCEKLLPNYVHFKSTFNWGDEVILQDAIVLIYQSLFNGLYMSLLKSSVLLVEEITPDTENFDSILCSFALDACTAVLSTHTGDMLSGDDMGRTIGFQTNTGGRSPSSHKNSTFTKEVGAFIKSWQKSKGDNTKLIDDFVKKMEGYGVKVTVN